MGTGGQIRHCFVYPHLRRRGHRSDRCARQPPPHRGEKIPDIHSLGEILRTVGRVLESEEEALVKIVKDRREVALEYVNRDGKYCKQELSTLDLRKVQQGFYENAARSNLAHRSS